MVAACTSSIGGMRGFGEPTPEEPGKVGGDESDREESVS